MTFKQTKEWLVANKKNTAAVVLTLLLMVGGVVGVVYTGNQNNKTIAVQAKLDEQELLEREEYESVLAAEVQTCINNITVMIEELVASYEDEELPEDVEELVTTLETLVVELEETLLTEELEERITALEALKEDLLEVNTTVTEMLDEAGIEIDEELLEEVVEAETENTTTDKVETTTSTGDTNSNTTSSNTSSSNTASSNGDAANDQTAHTCDWLAVENVIEMATNIQYIVRYVTVYAYFTAPAEYVPLYKKINNSNPNVEDEIVERYTTDAELSAYCKDLVLNQGLSDHWRTHYEYEFIEYQYEYIPAVTEIVTYCIVCGKEK